MAFKCDSFPCNNHKQTVGHAIQAFWRVTHNVNILMYFNGATYIIILILTLGVMTMVMFCQQARKDPMWWLRIDFAWVRKESNNCSKACSNLCRSFSIICEGLSADTRCMRMGKIIKAWLLNNKTLSTFFVAMKCKVLRTSKNTKAAVAWSTKVCYSISHIHSYSSLMVTGV